MIKLSVLYPNDEGTKFDFEYYCNKHIPMVRQTLKEACKGITVEQGIAGAGGTKPPFIAIGHLYFESVEIYRTRFSPHIEAFLADTDAQPTIQISEVKI